MKRPLNFAPGAAISLAYLKRNSISALGRHGPKWVRIWSNEHRAYWRFPANGYVMDVRGAGEYDLFDAFRRTRHCGPEKQIWFEFIRSTPQGHC